MLRVAFEVGTRWTFASAIDWPGWCRRAKGDDDDALEELLGYADRYRRAVAGAAVAGAAVAVDLEGVARGSEIEVVGRVAGDGTTDFGAPGTPGPWDAEPLAGADLERQVHLLEAVWDCFDAVVTGAPASLRKGPRGGGRDTAGVADHVREAERSYARKIGVRLPPRTSWAEQRAAVAAALRDGDGAAWSPRYFLRRCAWHVTDHAWEIEDRS